MKILNVRGYMIKTLGTYKQKTGVKYHVCARKTH